MSASAEDTTLLVGSVISNRAPPSGSDATDSVPPCCSTIILQIARPNPVPVAFVVTNGSNMTAIFLASIPGPVSSTEMTSASEPRRAVVTLMMRGLLFHRSHCLHRVLEQIKDDLSELARVTRHGRQI